MNKYTVTITLTTDQDVDLAVLLDAAIATLPELVVQLDNVAVEDVEIDDDDVVVEEVAS